MASNPYTYSSLGERWSVDEATTISRLNKARIKADANRWALQQIVTDPDTTPYVLQSMDASNLTGVGSATATAVTMSAKAAENIDKGKAVYISGASGSKAEVSLCDNTTATKLHFAGVAAETKTTGQTILIRRFGQLTGMDASGGGESWADGQELFMSTGGALTDIQPTSGAVWAVAHVATNHATTGALEVGQEHIGNLLAAASGADVFIRMGDDAAAQKVAFRNYSNAEVAYVNSLGGALFTKIGVGAAPVQTFEVKGTSLDQISFSTDGTTKSFLSHLSAARLHNSYWAVNRRNNNGVFGDTGSTAASIILSADNGVSSITLSTASVNNIAPTARLIVDGPGNVGMGVTPSTAHAAYSALNLGANAWLAGHTAAAAANYAHFAQNAHFDADASWEYISTDEASLYWQTAGTHVWMVAASGTAGNDITWKTALTIDNGAKSTFTLDVSTGYVARFFNDGNNADRYGIQVQCGADDASGTTTYFQALDGNGGEVGKIQNINDTFTFVDGSDRRMKENIQDSTMDALALVGAIRVREFDMIGSRCHKVGFVAQELYPVYPAAVSGSPDETDMMGVAKEVLIPVLMKAVQELQAEVTELKQAA